MPGLSSHGAVRLKSLSATSSDVFLVPRVHARDSAIHIQQTYLPYPMAQVSGGVR